MFFKNITMACAAAAMITVPASRVAADGRDFAAGIVAGVVGSAVVRNAGKKKRVVRQRTYAPKKQRATVPSYVRQERRDIQTSLNYFGFPAGTPDGVLGRNSRAAIANYQAHMGYAATGQLTDYEKNFLLQSYSRALTGGIATQQLIAASPTGPRGLLTRYRNEAAGVATAGAAVTAPVTNVVVAPQPQALQPQVLGGTTTTTTTVTALAGAGAATLGTATSSLPSFMGQTTVVSLASHCNQVSLLTSTNGGFMTAETMVDTNLALNEQFCLARTYAIAEGEQLVAKIQGFTPEQIAQQCEGFGPALKEHVAAMSLKPHTAVMQDVSGFVLGTGMSPVQLAGTAKICLSVGYRTDNMDVAIGSALLLAVLGEQVYSELMGHHLAQGFGVSKRTDLALPWYDLGLKAIENGATPVFAPGQPERNSLLRKASLSLASNTSAVDRKSVV